MVKSFFLKILYSLTKHKIQTKLFLKKKFTRLAKKVLMSKQELKSGLKKIWILISLIKQEIKLVESNENKFLMIMEFAALKVLNFYLINIRLWVKNCHIHKRQKTLIKVENWTMYFFNYKQSLYACNLHNLFIFTLYNTVLFRIQ